MPEARLYTQAEMQEKYGSFFQSGAKQRLDRSRVPEALWPLMPYAAFWGVADAWAREKLAQKAPPTVQDNLKAIVAAYEDDLDEWLAGDEASSPEPSPEYVAFSAMRMASDFM